MMIAILPLSPGVVGGGLDNAEDQANLSTAPGVFGHAEFENTIFKFIACLYHML